MENEELSADSYACLDDPVALCKRKGGTKDSGSGEKGIGGKRKRRFSDEQIKSLECTFVAQTKLEPRKKLQLARELGLQPRQVAIWFQNKRARRKSKQLEREYAALRADYDALLSNFEALEKEKQSLAKQLQKLAELLKKPAEASSDSGDSDQGGTKAEEDRKPSLVTTEGSDLTLMVHSAEEEFIPPQGRQILDFYGVREPVVDGPLALGVQECCFEAGSFSDQSCGSSSDWWEFWPLNE